MMTFDAVMEMLTRLGDDVTVDVRRNGLIDVTVEDFAGFDDDWSEVMRDYDEDAVENVYDALAEAAESVDEDYYTTFDMGTCRVQWGYASYDI